jgi:hypothetical protein
VSYGVESVPVIVDEFDGVKDVRWGKVLRYVISSSVDSSLMPLSGTFYVGG